jgi:uncharacterized protein YjdB
MHMKTKLLRISLLLIVSMALSILPPGMVLVKATTQDVTPALHFRMLDPGALTWLTSLNKPCSLNLVSGSGIYRGKSVLTATLQDDAAPLAGRNVFFLMGNRWIATSATDANGVASCTTGILDLDAGVYSNRISVYFAGDADYAKSSATGPLNVAKMDVVVTAASKSCVLGSEIPNLTCFSTGSSRVGAIEGITVSTTATSSSPVGTYDITVSGPASTDNLAITYVKGTLTIVAEPLVPNSVVVSGPASLSIPLVPDLLHDGDCTPKDLHWRESDETVRVTKTPFRAKVLDQNGNPMKGEHVVWSLLEPYAGVSVSSVRGVVAVESDALPGSFTLVATGGSVKVHTIVQLVPASPFAVQSIALDRAALTLNVGGVRNLHATVKPRNAADRTISWISSDPAVVTIDASGKMTAMKAGNAWITATTADNGFSATCFVTVKDPIPATGVSLDKTELTISSRARVRLVATVLPADATRQGVTWSSSETAVAVVDSYGRVFGIHSGTATITVTTKDGGYVATCLVTVEPMPTSDPATVTPYPDRHHD